MLKGTASKPGAIHETSESGDIKAWGFLVLLHCNLSLPCTSRSTNSYRTPSHTAHFQTYYHVCLRGNVVWTTGSNSSNWCSLPHPRSQSSADPALRRVLMFRL